MSLTHTPGPWKIESHYECENEYDKIGPIKRGFEFAGDAWIECSKSDARLIAAAPDMLEELIDIYKSVDLADLGMTGVGRLEKLIERATGMTIEEVLNETNNS